MSDGRTQAKKSVPKDEGYDNGFYGVLDKPNIKTVLFGNYRFNTWYGNAAYFNAYDTAHMALGYDFSNRIASDPSTVTNTENSNIDNNHNDDDYWLNELYVCEYCFKYTSNSHEMQQHRVVCSYNVARPKVGKLLYRDDHTPYLIREVRGFTDPLFCQNLCLFGKLFLDDKSVYYNIDHFNFYIVYGYDNDVNADPYTEQHFKPMGFFSKEMLAYDNDNNLACICVFPPFQRRHLGSLLIEFSYALAHVTPGQYHSGPEFPLSPYGKVSYLRFWSKKLASVITSHFKPGSSFSLNDISDFTGFRKEDILLTLEYMKLLKKDSRGNVKLLLGNLQEWCTANNVDPNQEKSMMNTEYLLL
ncbi:predicted protein [Scheffersomyces stipitis CBS 6054]|uniref:histone acetyltransferase n=1 Tax=Scheffersomyces stipitis (strain ATCC 58785 / CBS 6054 / NBRC 10063 / NRRL Y-11545) TaxID=322104 RepID=A3LMW7_PICST|nr:predicted protein [Scheffersomyces stipitis CBS 6054]ABN64224.2 predicted protein [Scheffersomyces stipitis CBS 6054]